MRASFAAMTMAGLVLAGCGTRLPVLSAKPAAMPTRPSCPAMKDEAWKPVVDAAVHKVFDRDLQKRFGGTAVQQRIAWSKTGRGDTVITALRIGPAAYALPDDGKGGALEVVFKACTGKVLKTRKLSGLERKPRPLAATN
ncbi:hypothetical protein [uncultured Caulobacter sp.]|uniref:hypothetical protein n=1 Tax=uncultured Caulobacter sp. TaxID=158749 RepID=UPI00260B9BCB|nr:hypothetical protein [uncultured Caulobacter sp.]